MGELQNPLEERKVEMGLVFKLTFKSFSLLAEVITGISLYIDEDSGETDLLEVWSMFSIERFATGAYKSTNTRSFELLERRFEIFIILYGDIVHTKGVGHLYGIAH